MKIAIAALRDNLDSKISPHFGRAPYFLFVDVENNKVKNIEARRNLLATNHEHGTIPQLMINENVDLVICAGIGDRARAHLQQAGIEIRQLPIITVKEALEKEGIQVKE